MTRRVLVTGGSGFIGTNLVEYLVSREADVVSLDVAAPPDVAHRGRWRATDILNKAQLTCEIESYQPDTVVHLAARTDLDGNSVGDYAANTIGVQNLIDAVARVPCVRRIIFASSRLVCRIGYQPKSESDYYPTTCYGESKVIGEKTIRESAKRILGSWVIVRPTSIWGPWFDVPYRDFFLAIARGHYFHPSKERILKSYGYVGNTVYQIHRLIQATDAEVTGQTLYLADYPPIDVNELATVVQQALGAEPIRSLNPRLLQAAAGIGDVLKLFGWKNPPLTTFRLNNLRAEMVYDLEPLRRLVGQLPFSMHQGVQATVSWMRRNGDVP